MEFRSTNALGYTHYQGEVIAGTGSSHGVLIGGGSAGGRIEAVGDDANINLTLAGKGTGSILFGNSTSPFLGVQRYTDTAVATPDFNTTNAMVMETTHTLTGVTSSHFLIAHGRNLSTDCLLCAVYPASTAGQAHCRFVKVSTVTVAASTATIDFLAFRF